MIKSLKELSYSKLKIMLKWVLRVESKGLYYYVKVPKEKVITVLKKVYSNFIKQVLDSNYVRVKGSY